MAAVAVAGLASHLPLPVVATVPQAHGALPRLILHEDDMMPGDLLVSHPSLTGPLGGCVALVIRHSSLDTLCLVLNVDCTKDVDAASRANPAAATEGAVGGGQAPPRRPHVHLPPLAAVDPRRRLPQELHDLPMHWGGPHPVPLHLLHSMPLVPSPAAQREPFQRLYDQEVYPGLRCSFVDEAVIAAVERALRSGDAKPSQFGAFVGMLCLDPATLGKYMSKNRWLAVRPPEDDPCPVPVSGWSADHGREAAGSPTTADDRQWAPWRALFAGLGGEFQAWASVDWVQALASLRPGQNLMTLPL
eukprot:gnl/TRDRNA2_/TRDRNA2_153720_c0_seq6.p1 gnl/TRDRNA2_/TRDRNA2_153720_c0~~gnl/TRDRNA2_/TRDRNA2_153720_c0_seq6.p1  ORF type:complete len:348 (-),score=45.58 gnl/TRDRNA2_/TRDRNA2_153720_c0_seq6:24-932(-)